MTDCKTYSDKEIFDFFLSRLQGLSAESSVKYRRTLTELDCFLSGHRLRLSTLTDVDIADWTVELLRQGLSPKTVARHLNILNSFVTQASRKGMLPALEAPRRLVRPLLEKGAVPLLAKGNNLEKCLRLVKEEMNRHDDSDTDTHIDLMLFSLLNNSMPLYEVAQLRRKDAQFYYGFGRRILERNISPRRDFIFDLNQSRLTPRQLQNSIHEALDAFFQRAGISGSDADAMVRSLWTECAMQCGATASKAKKLAGGPATYLIPAFLQADPKGMDFRHTAEGFPAEEWSRGVSMMFLCDAPRWYAMRIRRGVKYDELRKQILAEVHPQPKLFYPCETITRMTRSRKIADEQPLISDIVFFRLTPSRVAPLFRIIGDKAWCYRVSGLPGAPYATIPQKEMLRFQAAVGVFTPDTELKPLGTIEPKPGESVIVVMAGYGDREGTVEQVLPDTSGTAIIRVKFATDQGYEWRLDLDPRQLRHTEIQPRK